MLLLADAGQVEAIAKLHARAPATAIVALAAREDRTLCELALARGAHEVLALPGLQADVLHYAMLLAIERARGSRERQALDQSLHALFDLDAHPTWACDPTELRILGANRAAREAYGYDDDEFRTMSMADLLAAGDIRGSVMPAPGEIAISRHRCRDGRGIEVEMHAQGARLWGKDVLLVRARDVTAERRAMRALEASERRFRDFFEHSTGFIFTHDPDGTLLSINPAAASALGLSGAELLGTPVRDLAPPHLRFLFDQYLRRVASEGEDTGIVKVQHRDGSELEWQYRNRACADADGAIYIMGHAQDITAMRAVERALQLSERRLLTVADTLPLKIAYLDAQLRFVFANDAFRRAYGGADLVGKPVREVIGEERYQHREPWLQRTLAGERVVFEAEEGEGDTYHCAEITFIPETEDKSGTVIGLHAMMQDVTSKKREERRLIHLARLDHLTGLTNRAGFYEHLEASIERAREGDALITVFFLDIDRFKQVNDTHGHAIGDTLIRAFAQRISEHVRSSDVVARLGGDEFTVVMEGVPDVKRVRAIATKLVMSMSRPYELRSEGLVLPIGASIGVAVSRGEQLSASELVARADAMLYAAKQAGRGTYRIEVNEPPDATRRRQRAG
jgi:diguanylate cyclase (GGDEF)-like protein/PAS domain S-box-containing protein